MIAGANDRVLSRRAAFLAGAGLALAPIVAFADEVLPKELEGLAIEPKPGAELPRDLELLDQDGKTVRLGDYLDGKPLILQFAYFDCPMLCSLVMNGLLKGMQGMEWTLGKDFRAIVVSFDTRDTPEKARAKRKGYLEAYGRETGDRPWEYLTGSPEAVAKLAATVGFKYRWDAASGQFGHDAGAFFFNAEGKLARVLFGLEYAAKDLRFAMVESSDGKLGSVWDHLLLPCYTYDPKAKGYVVNAQRIMKIGGLATMVGIGLLLRRLFKAEKAKPPAEGTDPGNTTSSPRTLEPHSSPPGAD